MTESALAEFTVGIDEQDILALGGTAFVKNEHAGWDAGVVKQPSGQADDRFQPPALDEMLADVILRKRRIGQHPAEALEFAALRLVLGLGIDDLDQAADDIGRGVELAGLFAG